MANIDAEIQFQFHQGTAQLPRWAHYLFEGNMDTLLSTLIHHWKKWLASITAAQEMAATSQSQRDQELAASRQLMILRRAGIGWHLQCQAQGHLTQERKLRRNGAGLSWL